MLTDRGRLERARSCRGADGLVQDERSLKGHGNPDHARKGRQLAHFYYANGITNYLTATILIETKVHVLRVATLINT